MTMRMLWVAAFLATAVGCGSGMSTPGGANAPVSGGGTSVQADGGISPDDGGTDASCDCSGMALPDVCMMCSDGMGACAHFICVQGACAIQICQE
jgi:hypothetical protein